jgi:hypothetical protein
MANTKFMASALLAIQLMTGAKGALAQETPEPAPVVQTQEQTAEKPTAKAAKPDPTPEEIRRNKVRELLLDAAREDFLKISRGAEDRYSRDLRKGSKQFTRYIQRAEGDRALSIAFIDPAKFDAGMALGMEADAVTRMLANAQRTNVTDKVISDVAEEMKTDWKTPLGIETYTQNPSAHHDLMVDGPQSCVIVPPSAYHPVEFKIAGLTPQENLELINRHEGWHCLDHRSNLHGLDKDKVDKVGTEENAKALSILNHAESLADVGAAGDMIRRGMGTDLIDKLIVWRQDTGDLNHMSIAALKALKAQINDMGLDRFRRMNDKNARVLYETVTDENTLSPEMAATADAYQRASDAEKTEVRTALREDREATLEEAPELEKVLAFLSAYPSHVVPGFTYDQNVEYSRQRQARIDVPNKYNLDGLDEAKMATFDIDDFSAIKGDEELQKAVSLMNGKQAFADVATAGDLIRRGDDPSRVIDNLMAHNFTKIEHLSEATVPAMAALKRKIAQMGVDNFRRLPVTEAEQLYEGIVDANIMTPAMVKSVLEYADLSSADQRKADQQLSKTGLGPEFTDLKASLDFIKAYPETRVPMYSYQENLDFNRLREARLQGPGKYTQLPEDILATLDEAKSEEQEKSLDKPERLAALVTDHRRQTYADVAATGDMIRKGGNPTAVIDRLVEKRAGESDDVTTMSVAALKSLKAQIQDMGIAKFKKLDDAQLQRLYETTVETHTLNTGMAGMIISYAAADADDRKDVRRDAANEDVRAQYPELLPALAFMRDYVEPHLKDEKPKKDGPARTVTQERIAEQVEQWDALGALVDRAFKKDGKITPATLVDAYGDLQEGLRRKLQSEPNNMLYREQMNKLQQAFVDNVQEIDYVEANKARGVDIVQKERLLKEAFATPRTAPQAPRAGA